MHFNAIYRRLSGLERPENSPVESTDALLDAFRALQQERVGRPRSYSKRQKYLPFTIAASGGCERVRKEISRFAARARRGVNVQDETRFDVYDKSRKISTEIQAKTP